MRKKLRFLVRLAPLSIAFVVSACAQQPQLTSSPEEPIAALCSDRLTGEYDRIDITIAAEGRDIPFSLFAPSAPGEYKLITFSHGAFAAPGRYEAMLGPLAASGYVVAAPMHVDSEEIDLPERPSPQVQWVTRNADMRIALSMPKSLRDALGAKGVSVRTNQATAMGHSFGALMAQFAGGAQAIGPAGARADLRKLNVASVIAWSPPGPIPERLDEATWEAMAVPSLTLTGTADVLPGFIDDWQAHKASYEYAPIDGRALWVGEEIDHYFGGIFGRVKDAPGDANETLFARALATSLYFIEAHNGSAQPCTLGPNLSGETFEDIP